jgi:PAS domain S-box-containing protein
MLPTSTEDIRHALDQSAIVAITDADGVIIYINDKFCEISKYNRKELIGKTHRIVNSGYHSPAFFIKLWETISSGRTWVGEIKNRTKNGQYYWVHTTIVPLLGEDRKPKQYVSIRFEITQRKLIEEELKASNRELQDRETQIIMQDRLVSIGLLASGLAHEIGTPLSIIRGRAEILGRQLKDETFKNNASVILAQIDRISVLIKSLLNLARGSQAPDIRAVSLPRAIQDVTELLRHEFLKHQIEIFNETVEMNTWVLANSGELHQVLLNILVNAVHAIQVVIKDGSANKGEPPKNHHIRIRVEEHGQFAHICISDSGCGIPEAVMKNLFKPFFTTKDVGVGTGLGLATSYRIVEAWGGSIKAESSYGSDTIFRIILPRQQSNSNNL